MWFRYQLRYQPKVSIIWVSVLDLNQNRGFGHTLPGCHFVILFRFAKRSQNSDFFLSMNQDSNLSQVTQLFFFRNPTTDCVKKIDSALQKTLVSVSAKQSNLMFVKIVVCNRNILT